MGSPEGLRLAEKLNASIANGNKEVQPSGSERALRPAVRLFFLEDGWMILLQLPAFPNSWYFVCEGTLGTA